MQSSEESRVLIERLYAGSDRQDCSILAAAEAPQPGLLITTQVLVHVFTDRNPSVAILGGGTTARPWSPLFSVPKRKDFGTVLTIEGMPTR